MITIYTMDVRILEEPAKFEVAMGKIDQVRYQKIGRLSNHADKARSLGAGMLLQYCIQEIGKRDPAAQTSPVTLTEIGLREILAGGWSPRQLSYVYGENGKPYLPEYPDFFFSLSHSGNYVICAVSDREIGADIQIKKAQSGLRLAKRFFHEKEQKLLSHCSTDGEKRETFYRLWVAKEAYIKLTGQGIKQGFKNFYASFERNRIIDEKRAAQEQIFLWEQEWQEQYRIAVCCHLDH